jgi:pyruvate dehydrogenase E2 component (dihydrolipoyllysine-residue acetyltransferase)
VDAARRKNRTEDDPVARIDVTMPQMGESIAEGTVSKWLKRVGDAVKRDEPLFEISTDKVDAEIPSPAAGVIAEILVKEGETVGVDTVVARLESEKSAAAVAHPTAPAATAPSPARPAVETPAGAVPPPPPAAAPPVPAPRIARGNGNSLEDRLRTKSSPLVRKIAAEHGVELAALQGSGLSGRVTKRDLMQYLDSGAPRNVSAPAAHAAPMPTAWPGDRVEPMSKMRALISEHMVVSRHTSAHVTSIMEIDFTRVARIRAQQKATFEAAYGEKLSYMPFIMKATVDALKAYPVVNSSVAGTNVIYRRPINLGIAVALDWGLIVPVVRHAEDLSLAGLTKALNDLAGRARVKKLDPREVQDGTFTITNPGVFGSLTGTPIINQPQVAILCIGAIEKRAKVLTGTDGEDTIAVRTCSYISLSFDHRIIDGAVADQFLGHIKRTIETFSDAAL